MKFYLALFIFVAICSTAYARKKCFRIDEIPTKPPNTDNRCGAHEHYEECNSWCYQPTCEKQEIKLCKKPCEKGCFCDEGYVRDTNGKCIKVEECPAVEPTCTKPHEVYNCEPNPPCPPGKVCILGFPCGCICEEGYIKNDNGDCVEKEKPVCARAFEEYTDCGTACPLNCDNPTGEGQICTMQCVQGCFCQSGYVRDYSGECVKPEQCPAKNVTCGENEFYQACSTLCGEATCDSRTPRYCGLGCQPRCHCEDGYMRDAPQGKCIKVEECPALCTKPHEVYTECTNPCPPGAQCFAPCLPGCICEEGYIKNDNGDCVEEQSKPVCEEDIVVGPCKAMISRWAYDKSAKKCVEFFYGGCGGNDNRYNSKKECEKACPSSNNQCGAHEHYEECNSWCYQPTCEKREIALCRKPCEKGCFCDEGYVRDKDGKCIKVEECPALCTKPHEVYTECTNPCPPGAQCLAPCLPGCICEEGYIKNDSGDCVEKEKQVCARAFEEYTDCGTACPLNCDNPTGEGQVCTMQCVQGCFCQSGYVRDYSGECVKPEQCPAKNVTCGENEFYQACSTLCGEATCDSRTPRYCGLGCQPRCHCEDGYMRDAPQGKCIKVEECPALCTKPHEVYTECINPCPPDAQCFAPCLPGCICEEGYIKNNNGDCVEKEKPICAKAFEEYTDCGTACPVTCDNLPGPLICTANCVPGCFCEAGYVRDANGECIKQEQCPPKQPACKENEEYSECGANSCQDFCGKSPLIQCRPICTAGCICKEGYIKGPNEECVKPESCPPVPPECKEFEEYSECGANGCQATCDNPTLPQVCRAMCTAGCICKEGYIKDANGECIKQENCPPKQPVCAANEEYNDCGTACPRSCEFPDSRPCTKQCVADCFCKTGYVRNDRKECIKLEECPKGGSTCNQPIAVGRCRAAIKRYGYSSKEGKCVEFTYGGCGANGNNYETKEECDKACPPKKVKVMAL